MKIAMNPTSIPFSDSSLLKSEFVNAEFGLIQRAVFPREKDIHNHAPSVTECPNGDLIFAYYTGHGECRSDDVRIVGHRFVKGQNDWSPRMELANTPDYPDCNPVLFVSPNSQLWLWYPTILNHHWSGAILKFRVSDNFQTPDKAPIWIREGIAHVTPVGFEKQFAEALKGLEVSPIRTRMSGWKETIKKASERSKQKLYQRLGWIPRVRPIVLSSGRWLLPLYTDTFSAALAYYSDDQGKTWMTSEAMIGHGNIQPTFVERNDGTVVAYMRPTGILKRIHTAESIDGGHSWTLPKATDLPNPGGGLDCIKLRSGAWVIAYNDLTQGRWRLALSLSDDEGFTWPLTRYVAIDDKRKGYYHYPSLLQSIDGKIHMLYTDGGIPEGSTMVHSEITESWLRRGHPTQKPNLENFDTVEL